MVEEEKGIMKNKSVRLILSLAALGMLLGGYLGLKVSVSKQEESDEENLEEKKTNVFDVETDAIEALKFTIDDKEVTFDKKDGTWIKKDETDFPVDQDTLESAASSISSVSADRVLEDVEDLSEYGLDDPSNTITVITNDDNDDESETVFRVGIENDSTSQYYLCKDGDEKTVYVVANSVISPFMDSLYDYAAMDTFPYIDSFTISKVDVEQEDKSYEAVKDNDTGLWEIGNDEYDPEKADSSLMSSLTYGVSSLEYDAFVDYNCTDKSEYGLDDPYAVITVDYQEEEAEETDAEENDAEENDTEETDVEDVNAEGTDAEGMDTEETDAEGTDVEETDAEGTDEEEADAEAVDVEETDVEDTDEEEADAEESDVEETDSEEADVEEVDVEETDTEDENQDKLNIEENENTENSSKNTELSEDSKESESETTTMIDCQIKIFVGSEADEESRYVMIDGNNEVYTMTTEILSTVMDKDVSSMWDMTVNYISKDDLDSLDVKIDGQENTINVSRETLIVENDESEEDDETEESDETVDAETEDNLDEETTTETIVTYTLNGEEIEDLNFSSFYNKLTNMTAQKRLTEEYNPENEPEMSVVFNKVDKESVNVDFYQYDVNYYAAIVDNDKIYLVNKMIFKELRNSFEDLSGEEETEDEETDEAQES